MYILQALSLLLIFNSAVFAQNSLEYYLNQSLCNSPEISAIQSQIRSNSIDSIINIISSRVQVNFNANSMYAPFVNGYGYDTLITNGGNLTALIGASYTIFSGPSVNTQNRSLSLHNQILRDSLIIINQELMKTVTALYLTAYGDCVQWKNRSKILDLYSDEDPILKMLVQKGVYLQTDYLSFIITYKQQQISLMKLFSQYKNDLSALNSACGIIDTSSVDLIDPVLRLGKIPDTLNSVFFNRFKRDSLRIVTERILLKQSYYPKLSIGADAGFNSSLSPLSPKNVGASGTLNLSVPIYDGGQYRYKRQKIDIEEYNRLREKNFFKSQYLQQIASLRKQLDITQNLIDSSSKQLTLHQALIDADRKLLSYGEIKITDFISTISNFLDAQNNVAQDIVNRYQIINELNYWSR